MTGSRQRQVVQVDGRRLTLSNLDKVLYPEAGVTKGDVQRYFMAVADVLVPQAAMRPATRKRWPDGVGTVKEPLQAFFRKDLEDSAPTWVPRMPLKHSDHTNVYPLVNERAVLAWFGQVAALEIHVPQWRFLPDGTVENPDRMVLDLDPGPGTGLLECAELARMCRDILSGMGLAAVPVTSGSKGIHVYAALDGSYTSDQVSAVAKELARSLEADHPDLAVSDMKKSLREGKVLIDWSQNSRSKTTVCPYSLRGRAWPNVAAPRTWEELEDPNLSHLDMFAVMERVAEGIDPIAHLGLDLDAQPESATDSLSLYRSMRDPTKTTEPVPQERPKASGAAPIFVVQEHHARRLHFDTRLEHDNVLVSWAVPKGPPLQPGVNRLAVKTEDHPMEYATFEGTIPKGEYGAGEVTIWDSGTIEIERWRENEVIAILYGRPDGGLGGIPRRYVFVRTGENWLMRLMNDQPRKTKLSGAQKRQQPKPFTSALPKPMLATAGSATSIGDGEGWAYEGKWDGYRAIAGVRADGVELRSRNGIDLSATFPELQEIVSLTAPGTVLDGEVVALDANSRPNFARLQSRGKLVGRREIERAMSTTPVHYFVFDVLRTSDHGATLDLPYRERRSVLAETLNPGERIHIPEDLGVPLDAAIEISRELGLEGVVAKRIDSSYRPGHRSRGWLKIKHDAHQEVVIIGWRQGGGGRASTFGSLLLAVPAEDGLRYAGRVGTGFDEDALETLRATLERIRRKTPPVPDVPDSDRLDASWVTPKLVGEVRHAGRTDKGRLRHPVWRGLRPDKSPPDVEWE